MKERNNQTETAPTQKIMTLELRTFMNVGVFKSVRRAIKRGHCTTSGLHIPNRPFNLS